MTLQPKSKKQASALKPTDRIIFGTGDQLGYPTVTHDASFVNNAKNAGMILSPPPVIFDGVDVSHLGI